MLHGQAQTTIVAEVVPNCQQKVQTFFPPHTLIPNLCLIQSKKLDCSYFERFCEMFHVAARQTSIVWLILPDELRGKYDLLEFDHTKFGHFPIFDVKSKIVFPTSKLQFVVFVLF